MSSPSPYETAVKTVEDAQKMFNCGIKIAVQSIGQGAASVNSLAQEGYALASDVIGQGQGYVDHGVDQYKQLENQAFASAIEGIHWATANPYVSYPAAGASAILLIPFTRRLLWRQTLGRFRNPESVVRSCEGRVKGIGSRMEEYTNDVQKLQERMAAAETEYRSGMSKLKATRQEMQRLASSLASGERTATKTLSELRTISPKLENVLQLRGEAAAHAAALRSNKVKLNKWVNKIAAMDI